jgi:RNA polymerase sigma-70 factor (ECF subfamily)
MRTSTACEGERARPDLSRRFWAFAAPPAYTAPQSRGGADRLANPKADPEAEQGAGLPSRDAIIELLPRLRRYARALVGDAERADDLVQDCVERALSRWHLWRQPHDLRAWLFTIMHNIHANAVRRVVRGPGFVDLEHAQGAATPPDQIEHIALGEVIARLNALPEAQRAVVLLVALEGMTYDEVAKVLNVPVGTVMSRLSRARERLREPEAPQGLRVVR